MPIASYEERHRRVPKPPGRWSAAVAISELGLPQPVGFATLRYVRLTVSETRRMVWLDDT